MKNLTRKDKMKLIDVGNIIEIYDEYSDYTYLFLYVYCEEAQYAIFIKNHFIGYLYLDDYLHRIKSRKDEKKYLRMLLKEVIENNYNEYLKEVIKSENK